MRYANALLIGAIAAAIIGPVGARAADILTPIIAEPEPMYPVEVGSTWYLRGDIGYRSYADQLQVSYGGTGYVQEDLEGAAIVGIGIGGKFGHYFRADLTVDHSFKSDFSGRLTCPAPCGGLGGNQFSSEFARLSSTAIMANAYIDFGRWAGFAPYVGAGLGTAYVSVDDYNFINPNGVTGMVQGKSQWNLAYALMAGIGWTIADGLTLDAGYRYINLGEAKTEPVMGFNGIAPVRFKDISAHEVRIGFRYMID